MQGQVVHLHRQGLTLRKDNLLIALNARHRFTQQIHREHRQVRQPLLQPPQLPTNRHQKLLRTQHETHHQLARRRSSHQDILQLTATIRNVIGGQVRALNQFTQHRNSRLNRLHIERAFSKIRGCARAVIHDAEGRVLRRTTHHELRLVAEARLRAGHRVQPLQLRVRGKQGAGVLLLRLHLRGVGGLNAGAGGAEVITKIGTFHRGTILPPPRAGTPPACHTRALRNAKDPMAESPGDNLLSIPTDTTLPRARRAPIRPTAHLENPGTRQWPRQKRQSQWIQPRIPSQSKTPSSRSQYCRTSSPPRCSESSPVIRCSSRSDWCSPGLMKDERKTWC